MTTAQQQGKRTGGRAPHRWAEIGERTILTGQRFRHHLIKSDDGETPQLFSITAIGPQNIYVRAVKNEGTNNEHLSGEQLVCHIDDFDTVFPDSRP